VDDSTDHVELEPAMAAILRDMRARAASRPALTQVTPDMMRLRASAEFAPWNADPPPLASVEDREAVIADRAIRVRIYDASPAEIGPAMIYLHGGGWTIGDLDLEDTPLRLLAADSGVKIISVDYRLSPEHKFPAAIEDALAVIQWSRFNARELGIDRERLALGGASAGANLALGAALMSRDQGGPLIAFLLLMYGAYGGGAETESTRLFGNGDYGISNAAMQYFWAAYSRSPADLANPYVAPLKADLRGLPPCYLNNAGVDLLRDDTRALADRMRAAGVTVQHDEVAGVIHGFTQYARGSAAARTALANAAAALRAALGGGR
jgi:acetyl esterase